MFFRVALVHSMSFVFTVCRPRKDVIVVYDKIAEKTDDVLSNYPSANFSICAVFNIHHREGLFHLHITDEEGKYSHDFSIAYRLTQTTD